MPEYLNAVAHSLKELFQTVLPFDQAIVQEYRAGS
jgi:hypothetical protein